MAASKPVTHIENFLNTKIEELNLKCRTSTDQKAIYDHVLSEVKKTSTKIYGVFENEKGEEKILGIKRLQQCVMSRLETKLKNIVVHGKRSPETRNRPMEVAIEMEPKHKALLKVLEENIFCQEFYAAVGEAQLADAKANTFLGKLMSGVKKQTAEPAKPGPVKKYIDEYEKAFDAAQMIATAIDRKKKFAHPIGEATKDEKEEILKLLRNGKAHFKVYARVEDERGNKQFDYIPTTVTLALSENDINLSSDYFELKTAGNVSHKEGHTYSTDLLPQEDPYDRQSRRYWFQLKLSKHPSTRDVWKVATYKPFDEAKRNFIIITTLAFQVYSLNLPRPHIVRPSGCRAWRRLKKKFLWCLCSDAGVKKLEAGVGAVIRDEIGQCIGGIVSKFEIKRNWNVSHSDAVLIAETHGMYRGVKRLRKDYTTYCYEEKLKGNTPRKLTVRVSSDSKKLIQALLNGNEVGYGEWADQLKSLKREIKDAIDEDGGGQAWEYVHLPRLGNAAADILATLGYKDSYEFLKQCPKEIELVLLKDMVASQYYSNE